MFPDEATQDATPGSLLSEAERHRILVEWNGTAADYPEGRCVHELFEAQAVRTPDVPALVHEGVELSYAELNVQANRLARHLRERGVGADERVAICVERSPEMIVGLLAILKAGGAYVPLDPAYPVERLRHMIQDSGPVALLSHGRLLGLFSDLQLPILDLGSPTSPWMDLSGDNLEPGRPEHLAYVIYTSGSTGLPKGVMVEHRSLVNFAVASARHYGLTAEDRVLQFASVGFDAAAEEIYPILSVGGTLVLRTPRMLASGRDFLQGCEAFGISVLDLPTAYWQVLVQELETGGLSLPPRLRLVIIGGEAASPSAVRSWHRRYGSHPVLFNSYGPTEGTVVGTLERLDPGASWDSGVPIGRPIANARIYLLDSCGQPVPVGERGEIHIGGVGVARGYLNRPELTAERFLNDPFAGEAGARMYRTGDLGKWRPDGTLEFAGRNDFQVKIRGFRIELGEIEARLLDHPEVREAVVLAREERGGKRLVAYYVGGAAPGAEALRGHLAENLPEYMVPAAYVRLEALPLTPHGKVDRGALPEPEAEAFAAQDYEAPQGETEKALADIWTDVLNVDRVGRRDNFFSLGGHSLTAMQVLARVRDGFGVELPFSALYKEFTVAGLAVQIQEADRMEPVLAFPAVRRVPRDGALPLSYPQEAIWFIEQLTPGTLAYNAQFCIDFRGPLDAEVLERTFNEIVERHEVLRTTFPSPDGRPMQVVHPYERVTMPCVDISGVPASETEAEIERIVAEECQKPFDITRLPLVRWTLIRAAADRHLLIIVEHHFVHDGWSVGRLLGEIQAIYSAFAQGRPSPLPPLSVQYADFAAWQRGLLEGPFLDRQLDYWTKKLARPTRLELPTDYPPSKRHKSCGAMVEMELPASLYHALRGLGQRQGVTLFIVMLAAFKTLLHRYTGQEDVLIGTGSANRRLKETEGLLGMMINTLVLRTDLSGRVTFRELLDRVRQTVLEAHTYQDLPFEKLVEALHPVREPGQNPLFNVLFAFLDVQMPDLAFEGLQGKLLYPGNRSAKFDINLTVIPRGEQVAARGQQKEERRDESILLQWEYRSDLYDVTTIRRMMDQYQVLLQAIVENPERELWEFPILTHEERDRLTLEWNEPEAEFPEGARIHELFEAQAGRTPEAVALVQDGVELSYAELNGKADRLARRLRGLGVGPEKRVALCMERSIEMVVGLLAILKAGGAYVPLDPAYPAERLRYMLEDSAPVVLLTRGRLAELFPDPGLPVVDFDALPSVEEWPEVGGERPGPDHMAYVIYTSGSTGTPKGVVVTHRNGTRLFAATRDWFHFGQPDGWTLFHSYAFDFSVWEIWGALLHGGRLVVVSQWEARSPEDFYRLVCREGVTVLNQTPSAFRQLIQARIASEDRHRLRTVIFGGEALDVATLKPWFEREGDEQTRLVNMYGITETTVHVTYRPLSAADLDRAGGSPIGRRIPDLRVYILDAHGQPAPIGVVGELHVGGAGVARGYLNRPELSAARFLPDPFAAKPGARMYRTGDLGRWLPDGTIEFLGRNDFQVKIRGFRIELGEIEARLLEHPGIREAVVVARDEPEGERRLVAYYVGREAEEELIPAEALRAHLGEDLPEYMVPAAFVRLRALPLTPNGKLDRKALPAPEMEACVGRVYEEPEGDTETLLATLWAEILKVERVGRQDHFFELGGHSLLAARLVTRIQQEMGTKIDLQEVFLAPRLSSLAGKIVDAELAQYDFQELSNVWNSAPNS